MRAEARCAPRARLAAVGCAIDVASIEEWLASAEPRDELVYAWGLSPPRHMAAFARARELYDDREVRLHDRLRTCSKVREWYMVRRAPEPGPPCAPTAAPDHDETRDEALLRILRRCARFGLSCPTNAKLAAELGLRTDQAAYGIRLLRGAGRITVEDQGPGKPRRVAIVGTRLVTA